MEIKFIKNTKRLALLIGIIFLCLFILSSVYYKSLIVNPVSIWHGANLGVRSIFLDSESSGFNVSFRKELVENLGENIDQKASFISMSPNKLPYEYNVKNQIATNKALQSQLQSDLSRLDNAKNRLLNSKKTLDGLNQEFSSLLAYQQAGLTRKSAIEDALDIDQELPSEEQTNELLAKLNKPRGRTSHGIPEKVLNNVQQSTGISLEEINELMNK